MLYSRQCHVLLMPCWLAMFPARVSAGAIPGGQLDAEALAAASDTASAGFDRGFFVAYGHVVEPPLTLRLSGDTLLLNERYLLLPYEHLAEPPPITPSPRTIAIQELLDRATERSNDMFAAGRPFPEIMDAVESILEKSPLTAGAEQTSGDGIWIQFYSDEPGKLLDVQLTVSPPRYGPQKDWGRELAHSTFTELGAVLRRGGGVIYRRSTRSTFPAETVPAIRECIAQLRSRGAPFELGSACGKLLTSFQEQILTPKPLPESR